jgi:hypothetical protein
MTSGRFTQYASVFLRLALGASFLSAVADRFGLWGSYGKPHVRTVGKSPTFAKGGQIWATGFVGHRSHISLRKGWVGHWAERFQRPTQPKDGCVGHPAPKSTWAAGS